MQKWRLATVIAHQLAPIWCQGRFFLSGILPLGIHFSIVSRNASWNFIHASWMSSVSSRMFVMSIWDSSSLALSKSARAYFQLFLGLLGFALTGMCHFMVARISLWSEVSSGGMTLQSWTWSGEEERMRSMRVELPLDVTWVGCDTSYTKEKLYFGHSRHFLRGAYYGQHAPSIYTCIFWALQAAAHSVSSLKRELRLFKLLPWEPSKTPLIGEPSRW